MPKQRTCNAYRGTWTVDNEARKAIIIHGGQTWDANRNPIGNFILFQDEKELAGHRGPTADFVRTEPQIATGINQEDVKALYEALRTNNRENLRNVWSMMNIEL